MLCPLKIRCSADIPVAKYAYKYPLQKYVHNLVTKLQYDFDSTKAHHSDSTEFRNKYLTD